MAPRYALEESGGHCEAHSAAAISDRLLPHEEIAALRSQ